jgi:hypothetical protein
MLPYRSRGANTPITRRYVRRGRTLLQDACGVRDARMPDEHDGRQRTHAEADDNRQSRRATSFGAGRVLIRVRRS